MILEDATYEAFGHFPSKISSGSDAPIIAVCENCGNFKKTTKHDYHYLCNSCSKIFGEGNKGKNHPKWKPKIKAICENCGKEFDVFSSIIKKGWGKYCSSKCFGVARSKIRGKEHHSYGRTYTEEHKRNMSKNHADFKGKNNPCWRGGISFEPYCPKFNNAFKDYIREKFGNKCFLCQKTTKANGRKLGVHHVNYNKECGCDGDFTCQFVPLCMSCHSKTNSNREYWFNLITNKLHNSIIGWDV